MNKHNWDEEKMNLCRGCHFKDANPDLCHAVEPPMEKKVLPQIPSDCFYIPDSYWERISQEKKDELLEDLGSRSKRYWEKQNGK